MWENETKKTNEKSDTDLSSYAMTSIARALEERNFREHYFMTRRILEKET